MGQNLAIVNDIEEAIDKVRRGDRDAYRRVVDHFQLQLRVFVASHVVCREMVDEIAQTTFVYAYQHIGDYESGTNFYAWVRAIARNFALEELRRESREHALRQRYLDHVVSSETLNEAEVDDSRDRSEALRLCLEHVGDQGRDLLARRYDRNQPLESVAAEFGRSVAWVKTTLFRVREALRECIERRLRGEARS